MGSGDDRETPSPSGVFRQWSSGGQRPREDQGQHHHQQQEDEEEAYGRISARSGSAPQARNQQQGSSADPSADEGVPSADDPVFKGPFGLAVGVAEAADEEDEDEEEAAAAGGRSRGGGGTGRRRRPGKSRSNSTKAPY